MKPEIIGIVVAAASLAWAVLAQVRDRREQRKVLAFDLYQRVNTAFSDAIMQETIDPALQAVWDPLDDARRTKLEQLRDSDRRSGVWDELDQEERRQYRYTRRVFDVLEQASEAHRRELMGADEAMWSKWEGHLRAWLGTRWAPHVMDPVRERDFPRFHPEFVARVTNLAPRKT
ncbi:MAG: hypothetical protein JWO69_1655 [Thermoleophilia bacterium]|nr:hypothetical protein [Thermoleophilia bacterium]